MGGTKRCHASQSGMDQDIASYSSDRHHREAQSNMDQDRKHREASDLNEASLAAQILAERLQASQIRMGWCGMAVAASRDGPRRI